MSGVGLQNFSLVLESDSRAVHVTFNLLREGVLGRYHCTNVGMGDSLVAALGAGIAFPPSLAPKSAVTNANRSRVGESAGGRLSLTKADSKLLRSSFLDRSLSTTVFATPTTSGRTDPDTPALHWIAHVRRRQNGLIVSAAKTSVGSISVNTAENVAASLAKSSVVPGEVLLAAEGLAKTFDGDRYLFEDLNLTVA